MAERVIGLFGPTASGKSDVAAAIGELIPAEVVSADAMQAYDGLPILTNRSLHPERLVGMWPLSHLASVGEYAPLAHTAIDEILTAGRTPLVQEPALSVVRAKPIPEAPSSMNWPIRATATIVEPAE